jgi:hypothetical protein
MIESTSSSVTNMFVQSTASLPPAPHDHDD